MWGKRKRILLCHYPSADKKTLSENLNKKLQPGRDSKRELHKSNVIGLYLFDVS
jgi:tRNA uridine 5-carbamoylmethylation protein Kti12